LLLSASGGALLLASRADGRRVSCSGQSPPPPEIHTLSLHDALPISLSEFKEGGAVLAEVGDRSPSRDDESESPGDGKHAESRDEDRKSTRLNSSHVKISYAVFCLKKKIAKPSVNEGNKSRAGSGLSI